MKQADAVGDGIARAEICPLAKVPLRESRNELRPICEKLDLHTVRVYRLTNSSSAAPGEGADGYRWKCFNHQKGRNRAGYSVWLGFYLSTIFK